MVAVPAAAQEPIRYTLRFPARQSHLIDVEASYPAEGKQTVTLKMAVWTAYVVRDYADRVEGFDAPHGARKVLKNRWEVSTGGSPSVTVRYRVQAKSMHVQDNFVDANFALVNGQPAFFTLADGVDRPHEVKLELPPEWKTSISPMREIGPNHYRAADYEELVDSPIVAGNPTIHEFTAGGKPHRLVNVGEKGQWDGPRSVADLARMVDAQRAMWGGLPYSRYTFFNILSGRGGGMEHMESTVMMTAHDVMKGREKYKRWLDLASHEFFHVWNVKRLRPREITPGEYEVEQYTPSLGVAEGFTSYYSRVALRRAGLFTESDLREAIRREVETLESRPGRKEQSLADSSRDAWTVFYRPGPLSRFNSISYYNKGAVVGFLLDARISAATGGSRTLDDVMRAAWARYPRERGYTLEEFRDVASEIAGVDLTAWFQRAFYSTEELDYSEAERVFGWKVRP
jgi:predicted metalloprotease with PDZ domain